MFGGMLDDSKGAIIMSPPLCQHLHSPLNFLAMLSLLSEGEGEAGPRFSFQFWLKFPQNISNVRKPQSLKDFFKN